METQDEKSKRNQNQQEENYTNDFDTNNSGEEINEENNIDDGNFDENENYEDDENNEEFANFDDEVIFDNDEEGVNLGIDDDGNSQETYSGLEAIIITYSAFMYESPASLTPSGFIKVNLPTYFLPLSLQAVYGFDVDSNILDISIELDNQDWTKPPISITVQHPTRMNNFVGRPLVMDVIEKFFSKEYKPRPFYRSESYLLHPTGRADDTKKTILISEGFEEKSAERALIICSNNIDQAREFLCTGLMPPHDAILSIEYSSCPLLFLILEFADCFLNLQDHCCICGEKMDPGLKPSVCSNYLCNFRFNQIGLGSSVVQEIQRDPLAADLMVSLFSSAMNTEYLMPAPPENLDYRVLVQKFLSMNRMKDYQTDSQLAQEITAPAFELLRWILLSNRSQLISLPKKYKLTQFPGTYQFMTLISTPEAEKEFKRLKASYGSMFLWHGSNGVRWHSIIRNGLKNCSGTNLQANGAALGSGIYFARSSSTSWGYSHSTKNNAKSCLGKDLHIIGLCEVAQVPSRSSEIKGLKDHGWAHTLDIEEACVVRFLFVEQGFTSDSRFDKIPFSVDVASNPPKKVPTLRDMLNCIAGLE